MNICFCAAASVAAAAVAVVVVALFVRLYFISDTFMNTSERMYMHRHIDRYMVALLCAPCI